MVEEQRHGALAPRIQGEALQPLRHCWLVSGSRDRSLALWRLQLDALPPPAAVAAATAVAAAAPS